LPYSAAITPPSTVATVSSLLIQATPLPLVSSGATAACSVRTSPIYSVALVSFSRQAVQKAAIVRDF